MVLAMSNRGSVSIPARAPTRVRAQVPEEGAGGGRACEHDQPGRVLRSRGASVCVSHAPYPTTTSCAQRHKLGSNLTPVTRETFVKWKQTRMNKKEAEGVRRASGGEQSTPLALDSRRRSIDMTRLILLQHGQLHVITLHTHT